MENLRNLQELLFENKQCMPEELYIQLMNNLKFQFDNLPSNRYRIDYVIFRSTIDYLQEDKCIFSNTHFETEETNSLLCIYSMVIDFDQLNLCKCIQENCNRIPFRPFEMMLEKTDDTCHLLRNANILDDPDTLTINDTDIICQFGAVVMNATRLN